MLIGQEPAYRARFPALYSDFRSQRTLNPDGYHANIAAWQGALSSLCLRGLLSSRGSSSSLLILSVDELLPHHFENHRFGQPLALGTVIRQAVADHRFLSVNTFLYPQAATLSRNLSSITWSAAQWTARQLGIIDRVNGEDSLPTGRYVIVSNVEAVSREFKRQTVGKSSQFDRIFTRRQFQAVYAPILVAGQCLSEDDMEVLLTFLSRNMRVIDYDGEIIRIRQPSDEPRISPEDAAVASIKELTANLRHQTNVLNDQIDSLNREVRAALERENRIAAHASLKSKKLAESLLAKRYATLHQLEDIAAKVEQASDQVQLVNVMKSSANALRNLNNRVGGSETVQEVMGHIREQISDVDEVAAILAESTGEIVNESEIDEELEALETEARGKVQLEEGQGITQGEDPTAEGIQSRLAALSTPPSEIIPDKGQSNSETIEARVAGLSLEHS
ncbi:vacuolar sorting protein SNF7 family protein [Pochonia chlamydosporia 170]|uniref:Vacuolar sorting protein SNF7 family protein n=1 Tax=Pochonia chlamydosporia 170 TaxID=1380566 RepID=A0A179F9W4_METCM|nr:vacuolar sorting protein SNF7 family protein [Pochonia chlamydosporia 170]OAQ62242.1 vacuolar sorting protein SNF7 family protein [Pochonia chlamydosporia 170]